MTMHGVDEYAWRFGGLLGDLGPGMAWLLLGLMALAGLGLIVTSYHYSLVKLSTPRKIVLTTLRFLLLALILVLLAGPVKVTKTYSRQHGETPRPLAVLVDRSDSMKVEDNRHQQRADDARRHWLAIEPVARKAFSEFQTYAFARGIEHIAALDSPTKIAGNQTELFSALQGVLKEAPAGGWGGIVTLTDGLDTGGQTGGDLAESTIRAALAAGTPLYFVPGRNRYAGKSFLVLRDWNMPNQIAPLSTFQLEVALDSFQSAARSVPLRLRVGNQQKPTETLRLEAGRKMFAWTTEVKAESVGVLPIELQIGDGEQAIVVRAEIHVEAPANNRILYFQGALDWGYKFLADILRDDPEFTFTPILALAPNDQHSMARLFPATAAGLAKFDIVVLSNAEARQFSDEQQAALTEWVRGGGVLLFLAPDDATTQGYAGSELEKMLPVVFARGDRNTNANDRINRTRENLRYRSQMANEGGDPQIIHLAEFSWEPAAKRIFGEAEIAAPQFSTYAHVLHAKPGAEILARHPTELSPEGADAGRAILLALQRYGRGQSAVLTSDALWRWKLNRPSKEHEVEKFWRHLFSWLGRDRVCELGFDHPPFTAESGQEIILRLLGVGPAPIQVEAVTNQQTPIKLESFSEASGTVGYRWRPVSAGDWTLTATELNGRVVRHWIHVQDTVPSGENSGLPVDEVLMTKLAERTGGAVLNDIAPEQWIAPRDPLAPEVVSERYVQLWHRRYVLVALMTCYALELLLRRRWLLL